MSTDVDADGQVAAKMAKKSDEDDLMDLWGVSTFVSGGTSAGSGRNRDKADSSSAQPKKRVKGTSSVPVLSARWRRQCCRRQFICRCTRLQCFAVVMDVWEQIDQE